MQAELRVRMANTVRVMHAVQLGWHPHIRTTSRVTAPIWLANTPR